MVVIDFETHPIVGNPIVKPPRPVGFAVYGPSIRPTYLAWGHPTNNNCRWQDAAEYLGRIRDSGEPLLFHNAPFDISVWNQEFPNSQLWNIEDNWERFHDTMYLLFLDDPYSRDLGLKPSASRYLGMAPDEQDELKDWILAHCPGATDKTFGQYIALSPGDLCGRYACGDVVRTFGIYEKLLPTITERGMLDAYNRERKLMPRLVLSTRRGIRLDRDTLEYHTEVYQECLDVARVEYSQYLGCDIDVLANDNQYADALERSGAVKEWVLTPTGKRSMAKKNIKIADPKALMYHRYIGKLETCLGTFMRPWLEFSREDGRVHPNWNQVRGDRRDGDGGAGARTGRLSSDSPNFQNVPTEFVDATGTPYAIPEGLHPLPMLRRYCLPEIDHIWIKRDYSSQEVRLVAHYEDGSLCELYRADASLDPHQLAVEIIQRMTGTLYARKTVKITAFAIIYGSGAAGLSLQLGVPYAEAKRIREAYLDAMPGIRTLMDDVKARGSGGQAIKTLGGRIYYAEPPKVVNGAVRDFAYKLLNYLIQGSAADQTKDSINDWFDRRHERALFLATVHDELNISAPADTYLEDMQLLRECMDRPRLDVPVASEGFYGHNWADLKECA